MKSPIRIKNKKLALLIAVFSIGILLRIFKLADQSVWIDEFVTTGFAAGPDLFHVFFDCLANNPHPPLFFMLEHIFCGIFGYSEFSLRFLPFVFSVACMFVFYRFVRVFFNEEIGLIAAVLFCLNPYQIYYAQEARNYTMFLLISMLMLYYFVISVKYNSFMSGQFIFWSVLGIYTHSFAVILLIIMNAVLIIGYREEIRMSLWLKAQGIIAIFFIPLLVPFLKNSAAESYYHNANIFLAPLYSIKNYLFGMTFDWNVLTIIALIGALFIIFIGTFTYRQKYIKITGVIFWISAGFMAFPWIISLITSKAIYSERIFILVSATTLILLSVGISYMSSQGKALAMAVMLLIYSVALFNYYFVEKYQKSDYKKQYTEIAQNFREGDIIVHSCVCSYASFEFYSKYMNKTAFTNRFLGEIPEFHGSGLRFRIRDMWRGFKEDVLKKKFGIDIYAGFDKNTLASKEAMEIMGNYKRVWFVRDSRIGEKQVWLPIGNIWNSSIDLGVPPEPDALPWVEKYFRVVSEEHFYADDVFLLERK
jgi:uncharacterized membrane protein